METSNIYVNKQFIKHLTCKHASKKLDAARYIFFGGLTEKMMERKTHYIYEEYIFFFSWWGA